jgi:hypothetical protein
MSKTLVEEVITFDGEHETKRKEDRMIDIDNRQEKCSVCKKEYTSIHTEVMPGVRIYVCDKCLESAKHNFIWICMSCGKVYLRPKKLVLEKLNNFELKQAYTECENMQIIQGIDMCISCDPEGVLNYMEVQKTAMEC